METATRTRSIAKALTWRALGTLDTFVLGYIITGHIGLAGAIASTEVLTKTALYYLHERGWSLIGWGHTPVLAPVPADRLHHTL